MQKSLYRKIDCCTMGRPLSVTLNDIHMVQTDN